MLIKNIGFTGTSAGMTAEQTSKIANLLIDFAKSARYVRHGMCIGADEEFHKLATHYGYYTIGHPGVTKDGRAYKRSKVQCTDTLVEMPFLVRNVHIVEASHIMLATPKGLKEEFRGSGTWHAIRYAEKVGKELYIVWPDGQILHREK